MGYKKCLSRLLIGERVGEDYESGTGSIEKS